MKNGFFSISTIAIVALSGLAFSIPSNNGELNGARKVDVKSSTIEWKGYKVTGSHTGFVTLKNGNLTFNNGTLTGGNFEIDMNTITCTDLQGEWATKLVNHLKSDDFFGVATHPIAKFEITKAIPYGTPGSYKINGNVTIKGKTTPIKFNANVKEDGGKIITETKLVLDRSEFDVRYGSGSFFDNLGDKTIYDEFDIIVKLVTNK